MIIQGQHGFHERYREYRGRGEFFCDMRLKKFSSRNENLADEQRYGRPSTVNCLDIHQTFLQESSICSPLDDLIRNQYFRNRDLKNEVNHYLKLTNSRILWKWNKQTDFTMGHFFRINFAYTFIYLYVDMQNRTSLVAQYFEINSRNHILLCLITEDHWQKS